MKKTKTNITFAIIFIIIALVLVVVGIVRSDPLSYIRAVIFAVAACYMFWREKRKNK